MNAADRYETYSEDVNDYCFFDFETCNLPHSVGTHAGNLPKCGHDVYTDNNSFPVLLTYAIGAGDVGIAQLDDFRAENVPANRLCWDDQPKALHDFYERALAGKAWFVAWNTAFDRAVWNSEQCHFPPLPIEATKDAMVQAMSSGLPDRLEVAGRNCGFNGKYKAGGKLMPLFCNWGCETPKTRPDLWNEYVAYGAGDTILLRDVFMATRKLPRAEWKNYWINERINQRGLAVDVGFARRAQALAARNTGRINADLRRLTGGKVDGLTKINALRDWIYDRLESSEARDIMVKTWELDDEGSTVGPAKLWLNKDSVLEPLLAWFATKDEQMRRDHEDAPDMFDHGKDGLGKRDRDTLAVVEHRYYGGGTTPAKYSGILRTQRGGVLRGQYRYNGAAQTGRYSSFGVQIHNLMRASLGDKEADFIEAVNEIELEDEA